MVSILLVLLAGTAYTQDACMICHSDPSITTLRNERTVSLSVNPAELSRSAHAGLDCPVCHRGLDPGELPHATRIRPVNCLTCHEGDLTDAHEASVHGPKKKGGRAAASCKDCHGTHAIRPVSELPPEERASLSQAMCATCHRSVMTEFSESDHGKALAAGIPGAPGCIACHGEHGISSPSADSTSTSRALQAKLCESCHLDNPEVRKAVGPTAGFIASYEKSVHGIAFREGNEGAATCTDCHGSHAMKKGSDPASLVSKKNISSTCGKCHGEIRELYDRSVHGTSVTAGVNASASCTDCHGEHQILSPKDARSPVAAGNVSTQVCSPCHSSVRLSEKYGISSDRFRTFEDSYHGLAGRSGSVDVANCASCHGVHDILPSTDPASRIHPANLAATCGSCHPGANENFTSGKVHYDESSDDESILSFVATLYIFLIAITIGGMFFHNLIDFIRKSKEVLRKRRSPPSAHPVPHRLYLRMSLEERIQHGILMAAFFVLVMTGFMLKFPEAWWVVPIRAISPTVFEIRSLLHRFAGVVMILVSLYHLYYVLIVPRGKNLILDLLPVRRDLTDPFKVIGYNLGLRKEKPKFGRFSYIEKAEYWALVWGTTLMGLTGIVLWFENTFLGLFGKLWWDVGLVIHYYEAWLATLAILVWHLYFVIANPDVYPMNLAWWKGTLSEEEMQTEHPLELERIKESEVQEETHGVSDQKSGQRSKRPRK